MTKDKEKKKQQNKKQSERRKERYRTDPEYRKKINDRNNAAHKRRREDPKYVKIRLARQRIWNARVSIEHHQERLKFFEDRIVKDAKLLNQLLAKQ